MIPDNSRRGMILSSTVNDAKDIRDISDSDNRHVRYITDYINRIAKSCSIEDAEYYIQRLAAYGRKDLANIFIVHHTE